jgi:hypothetical protein
VFPAKQALDYLPGYQAPKEINMFFIDYVIVHEWAHLIEADHTARFWNVVKIGRAHV